MNESVDLLHEQDETRDTWKSYAFNHERSAVKCVSNHVHGAGSSVIGQWLGL